MSDGEDPAVKKMRERNDRITPTLRKPAGLNSQIDKSFEEIEESFEQRRAYGQHAAKEHAKEAIEELYASEFPIDNPPDSWERYEAELSVRHLRESVENLGGLRRDRGAKTQMMLINGHEAERLREGIEQDDPDVEQVFEEAWGERVQQCKDIIDVMATYGELAESDIAALTRGQIHSVVRAYATETLAEVRDGQDESKSLTAAIRDWWHGGRSE